MLPPLHPLTKHSQRRSALCFRLDAFLNARLKALPANSPTAGGIRKRTGAPLAAAPSGIVGRLYHNGEQLAENFEAVFNKVGLTGGNLCCAASLADSLLLDAGRE